MIRILSFPFLLGLIMLLSFCSSESEGDLRPDCSVSGLEITEIQVVNAECSESGSITINASGGEGTLMYSLGGNVFQMSSTFGSLSSGNYAVAVRDENECTISSSVTVGINEGGLVLTVDTNSESGCGTSTGTITLSAEGGVGNYTFRVDGGSFGTVNEFSGLPQGNHTVQVADEEGCTASREVYISSGIELTGQIMPIIENNCAVSGCHGDVQVPIFDGENAVRNNAEEISSLTSSRSMPPDTEPDLTQNQVDLISCWAADVSAGL